MRLILMRHAKSSWAAPTQSDHARPLNGRGRRSAGAIGDWLRRKGYLPEMVLCSSAARTSETYDLLRLKAHVRYEDRLYHADVSTLWDSLNEATGETVLMIGHNPGLAEFAATVAEHLPHHPRLPDFPTCATLVVSFPAHRWAEVQPRSGTVEDFILPRELLETQ